MPGTLQCGLPLRFLCGKYCLAFGFSLTRNFCEALGLGLTDGFSSFSSEACGDLGLFLATTLCFLFEAALFGSVSFFGSQAGLLPGFRTG